MKAMQLHEVAQAVAGVVSGAGNVTVTAADIDSRRIQPGSLFVAIRGPRFDGHDFVAAAAEAGAVAAIVERPGDYPLPVCQVADARAALGRLGRYNRRACQARVAAITGSNGKTTVKEMLASILRQVGPTLATEGNLNNELGVPLTLLRLDDSQRYAVVEMGANHAGEIDYLTSVAEPEVGVVNNAGPAHLEGFGDLQGVARAKGELFAALPADGTAVINADDDFAPLWRELAGRRRVLDFGIDAPAQIRASREADGWVLSSPVGGGPLRLPVPGRHNVMNALAAASSALALDVPVEAVLAGLAAMRPAPGRLQWRQAREGARLLDDTYNANPSSLRVGVEVLVAERGEHWLVLGDMAELGAGAREVHAEAGVMARRLGVDRLLACGELSAAAAEAFGEGGEVFPDKAAAIEALVPQLRTGVNVLVKGSRSAGMEQLVQALAAPGTGEV